MVGVLVTGMTFAAARDSFLISNASIGTVCALCGGLIAAYRPRNALGWLLLGVAVAQTATAAVTPWLARAIATAHGPATTWTATVYSAAWPWAIGLFLPLALLVFPDGRLPTRDPPAAARCRRGQRRRPGPDLQRRPLPARDRAGVRAGRGGAGVVVAGDPGSGHESPGHSHECPAGRDLSRRRRQPRRALPPRRGTGPTPGALAPARRRRHGHGHRRDPDGLVLRGARHRVPGHLHAGRGAGPGGHHDRRPAPPPARHPAALVAHGHLRRADGRADRDVRRRRGGRERTRGAHRRAGRVGGRHRRRRRRLRPDPGPAPASRRLPALRRPRRPVPGGVVGDRAARGRCGPAGGRAPGGVPGPQAAVGGAGGGRRGRRARRAPSPRRWRASRCATPDGRWES